MARSVVSTLHTHSVVSKTVSNSTSSVLGVEDYNVDPQIQTIINHAGGDHRPSYVAAISYSPVVNWSCSDIGNAVTLFGGTNGLDGQSITGGTDTLDFYFAKKQKEGTRASGSNHTRARMFDSFTILEEITGNQNAHATARFRSVGIYDATNEPLIFAGSVALPSSISNLTTKFKMGQVQVNGSTVDGITSITVRTGIDLDVLFAGGDHRPSWVGMRQRVPIIEFTTLELPYFTTITPVGAKGTTAFAVYFYKIDEFGNVVADVTAEHIKISGQANQYRVNVGSISVRNNDNASFTTTLYPMHDGTNYEWTFSSTSAVT